MFNEAPKGVKNIGVQVYAKVIIKLSDWVSGQWSYYYKYLILIGWALSLQFDVFQTFAETNQKLGRIAHRPRLLHRKDIRRPQTGPANRDDERLSQLLDHIPGEFICCKITQDIWDCQHVFAHDLVTQHLNKNRAAFMFFQFCELGK